MGYVGFKCIECKCPTLMKRYLYLLFISKEMAHLSKLVTTWEGRILCGAEHHSARASRRVQRTATWRQCGALMAHFALRTPHRRQEPLEPLYYFSHQSRRSVSPLGSVSLELTECMSVAWTVASVRWKVNRRQLTPCRMVRSSETRSNCKRPLQFVS